MLNPFAIEKETLQKLNDLQKYVVFIQKNICYDLLVKEVESNVPLPAKIKIQCQSVLNDYAKQVKFFSCKYCDKVFDDGRKLGGHISRAHKSHCAFEENQGDKNAVKDQVVEKKQKKIKINVLKLNEFKF